MGKKTLFATGELSVVQYMPPRLVKAAQGWYVIFYTVHPDTLLLERHRKSYNLGRIGKKRERQARADTIMEAIEELLPVGYPWVNGHQVYDIDRFISLRKKQAAPSIFKSEKSILECIKFVTDLKCQSDRKETVKTYLNAYRRFEEFLDKNGLATLPVTEFVVQHAQAYMDDLRLRVGNNTYNNYRGQIIVLFNAMKSRGMVAENPFLKTSKVPKAKKRRRAFTQEEAALVLEEIYNTDFWLFILVLLHLGEWVRRTEAYRLRFSRFHLQEGYILMTEQDTKNRQESVVTIPKDLLVFFLDERFTVWPGNYLLFGAGGQPHPSQSAGENTFKLRHRNLLIRLKTEGKLKDINGLSLYSWKDTGMTAMARILTPFQLRDHARHHDTEMAMRYYHAEKTIPEVRDAHLPMLTKIVKEQKERLRKK